MLKSVELFAGAGGLALGASLSGFEHAAVVEWDKWACDTVRENQRRLNPLVSGWPLHETDVRVFDFPGVGDRIDLVSGGPPCQPFSLGGRHLAHADSRDMFPAAIDAVRRLRPRAFLIENVKGLTRAAFADYFRYILLRLASPWSERGRRETPGSHAARLEKEKDTAARDHAYDVAYRVVNAADYGVPQCRERVLIVGFRRDLDVRWTFPEQTHSREALLRSQWATGEYWERHGVAKRDTPAPPDGKTLDRIRRGDCPDVANSPWLTVRDALLGLPDPRAAAKGGAFLNHVFQPGARAYAGHTGSLPDMPAKTLKAGDHGVPGGENMLAAPSGELRYFTARESARLQTFPDTYAFSGAWSEIMRQLGNAVPVTLARVVAGAVAERLIEVEIRALAAKRRRVA